MDRDEMPAMYPPLSEHIASLDWPEIRRQFEAGASIRSLATKHGIASRTTIQRRIAADGWRTPDQADPLFVQYAPPAPSPIGEAAPSADYAPDPAATVIPLAELVAERALHTTAAEIMADDPDAQVLGADDLADLHTTKIRTQLAVSDRVTTAGLRVFELINRLLDDDADPKKAAEASFALRRLTNVNPDRDTLAGLLKAASDIVARGVAIERRALGMDVKRATVESVPDSASPRRPAGALIKMLDTEMAFKLRELAQRMIMERRQSEITAQV